MIDSPRVPFVFVLSVISGVIATDIAAQTCATPERASVGTSLSGNTCDGASLMPTQNHGSILTPGPERVLQVSGTYGVTGLVLSSDASQIYVFVCSGCGVNADCVASGESNEASTFIPYPNGDGPYYVVVDTPPMHACSDYTLQVVGPLKKDLDRVPR
jgi:hypothetical protein